MYRDTRVVVLSTKELEKVIRAVKRQPYSDITRSALDQLQLALTGGRSEGVTELPENAAAEYREHLEERIGMLEAGTITDDADNWEAWQAEITQLTAYMQIWPQLIATIENVIWFRTATGNMTETDIEAVQVASDIILNLLLNGQLFRGIED